MCNLKVSQDGIEDEEEDFVNDVHVNSDTGGIYCFFTMNVIEFFVLFSFFSLQIVVEYVMDILILSKTK